jgi:hypothetical protein
MTTPQSTMGRRLLDLPEEILLEICSSVGYRDFFKLGRVRNRVRIHHKAADELTAPSQICRVFARLSQCRSVLVSALLDLNHTRPVPFGFPGPYTIHRISSRPVEDLKSAFTHGHRLECALSKASITPRCVIQHTERIAGGARWVNYIKDRYCMIMTHDNIYYCFIRRDTGRWSELYWGFRDRPERWCFDYDSDGVTVIIDTRSQESVSRFVFSGSHFSFQFRTLDLDLPNPR